MGAFDIAIRITGIIEARQALGALLRTAEDIDDESWWVGTVVQYSAFLEYGTARMRARPYFRPALRRAAAKFSSAEVRTVAPEVTGLGRQEVVPGREEFTARFKGAPGTKKLGAAKVSGAMPARRANKLGSFDMSPSNKNAPVSQMVVALREASPEAFAAVLEKEVKQMIKSKGLIDTGNLRASFVAAPTLPKLRAESLEKIPITAESDDGRVVRREDIVNLES